jgi:hypothetical protein
MVELEPSPCSSNFILPPSGPFKIIIMTLHDRTAEFIAWFGFWFFHAAPVLIIASYWKYL